MLVKAGPESIVRSIPATLVICDIPTTGGPHDHTIALSKLWIMRLGPSIDGPSKKEKN